MSAQVPNNGPNNASQRQVISRLPIRRFARTGRSESLMDSVVRETRVELVLNDEALLALMCLPWQVEELAIGFLYTEGILPQLSELCTIHFDAEAGVVSCSGRFDPDAVAMIRRRWAYGTGCGGGGSARDFDHLAARRPTVTDLHVAPAQLASLARRFQRVGGLYRQTGGVHACALATPEKIELFAEDIGRHNAFDKVAGLALRAGITFDDKIGLTTGRITFEIVSKAVAVGLGILASSSAPTDLAVALAKRFALTLVGFLRGERMNIYSGHAKIAPGPTDTDGPAAEGPEAN